MLFRSPQLRQVVYRRPRLAVEKEMLSIPRHWPDRVCAGFPLKGLLLPVFVARDRSRVVPGSAGDARNCIRRRKRRGATRVAPVKEHQTGGVDGTRTRDPRRDRPVF